MREKDGCVVWVERKKYGGPERRQAMAAMAIAIRPIEGFRVHAKEAVVRGKYEADGRKWLREQKVSEGTRVNLRQSLHAFVLK